MESNRSRQKQKLQTETPSKTIPVPPPLEKSSQGTGEELQAAIPRSRPSIARSSLPPPPQSVDTKITPTVIDDPFAVVDRALGQLKQARIAFNAPEMMKLGDTATVQLLLNMRKTIDELSEQITAEGAKKGVEIQVSSRMEASLKGGDAFEITALAPDEQPISATADTEWRWRVKPKVFGKQILALTLYAILPVQGTNTKKFVKAYDYSIEVQVTMGKQVTDFVGNNWQWLWSVFVVPAGAWMWTRRRTITAGNSVQLN